MLLFNHLIFKDYLAMNKWISKYLCFIACLFIQSGAQALALTDIKLNSSLNQPLDAVIELKSASASELDSLSVIIERNARSSTRSAHWPDIKVELVRMEKGNSYLKLTSKDVVREPVLNFLVEASWSTGRIQREYKLLLNPPR